MSRERLVSAVRRVASAHAQQVALNQQLGTVVATDPDFVVELLDADIVIREPVLTQWVKKYHASDVIDIDDLVFVSQRGNRWVITDVIADKDPS